MRKLIVLLSVGFVLLFAGSMNSFAEDCGRFVPEPRVNNFVLVLDRSGSMSGPPIEDARNALTGFIRSMQDGDRAALVTFESNVRMDRGFTENRQDLISSVMNVRTGDMTRFYDAVAKASQILSRQNGMKVIIFLTDGNDNMSAFNLQNIREMNIGEGIFVYGIGLGDVDHTSFRSLADATGGEYRVARSSGELATLYEEVRTGYYRRFRDEMSDTGGFTVTSVPTGRPVTVDGVSAGRTPVKIDARPAGRYDIRVGFQYGTWECSAESRPGYRNIIQAREVDLPTDLIVESAPHGAAVFIDGAYVGMTTMIPSKKTSSGRDVSNQLRIPSLSRGTHHMKIIAVPDFDFSGSQIMEFDFVMGPSTRYVNVLVFMGRAEFDNGEVITAQRDPVKDAFERLDSMMDGTGMPSMDSFDF